MHHCNRQLKKEKKSIHSSLRSVLAMYFYLSIEHKVLCTTLWIFLNYNGIFVTAVLARNLLYKVQQLVMKY